MDTGRQSYINFSKKEITDIFYFYTGEVSKINRQLSLVGVAIIWLFKSSGEIGEINSSTNQLITQNIELPDLLLIPLFGLALSLVFDLIQYLYGAILYDIMTSQMENFAADDKNVKRNFIRPMAILFYSKVTFALISYGYIFTYILSLL